MSDERRVKRVKVAKGKVEIIVHTGSVLDPDEISIKSADEPRPQLPAALQALAPHVLTLCELRGSLEVRSVSFSYTQGAEDEIVMGASVSGLRPLASSRSPMVVNSPHVPESDYGGNEDSECVLDADFVDALDAVVVEALAYVDGQRAQGQLFEEKRPCVLEQVAGIVSEREPAEATA